MSGKGKEAAQVFGFATIKACMTGIAGLGYSDNEIRAMVKDLVEIELSSRYYQLRNQIKEAMETMTIDDLTAIVVEMEEGGEE